MWSRGEEQRPAAQGTLGGIEEGISRRFCDTIVIVDMGKLHIVRDGQVHKRNMEGKHAWGKCGYRKSETAIARNLIGKKKEDRNTTGWTFVERLRPVINGLQLS